MMGAGPIAIWCISAATVAALLLRPWRIGEWVWALAGASLLVAARLLPVDAAVRAVADGVDVYLFLLGMLLLSEVARAHGAFDWLGGLVLRRAAPRATTLLALVYVCGVIVTALLSNDGTIVLLTPAVLAITRRSNAPRLPLLYACAFVANAASFVLPISNPANLVIFRHLPSLGAWLVTFGPAAAASIACTYGLLWCAYRTDLARRFACSEEGPLLTDAGKTALAAVAASVAVIVISAALEWPVAEITFWAGIVSLAIVAFRHGKVALVLRHGPWSIVPLVAALFVIVAAFDRTGVLGVMHVFIDNATAMSRIQANVLVAATVLIADNVLNNLPVAVLARFALHDHAAANVVNAALVGVDLGPNLSLNGSLATLLWLVMLRREGVHIAPLQFLRIGAVVTVPPLLLAVLFVR